MLTQIGNPVIIAITIRTVLDIPPESDWIGVSKVVVWNKKKCNNSLNNFCANGYG